MSEFKIKDKVRLTGESWSADLKDTVVEVTEFDDDGDPAFRDENDEQWSIFKNGDTDDFSATLVEEGKPLASGGYTGRVSIPDLFHGPNCYTLFNPLESERKKIVQYIRQEAHTTLMTAYSELKAGDKEGAQSLEDQYEALMELASGIENKEHYND